MILDAKCFASIVLTETYYVFIVKYGTERSRFLSPIGKCCTEMLHICVLFSLLVTVIKEAKYAWLLFYLPIVSKEAKEFDRVLPSGL